MVSKVPLQRRFRDWTSALVFNPWVISVVVVAVGICACHYLPQREGQPQSVGQIMQDILLPAFRWAPSWCGLWLIDAPHGRFNNRFPSAEEIVKEARDILPLVDELRGSKFFRIFKVDLDKECPFWAREDLCKSPSGACHVCECPEDQIPEQFKKNPEEYFVDRQFYDTEEISPWTEPLRQDSGFMPVLDGTDLDGHPSYVDLSLNPPGFTAYKGRNIWELIYKENCIRTTEDEEPSSSSECTEENTFEYVISGLQTAIITLSSEYNAPSTSWFPMPLTTPSKYTKSIDGKNRGPTRHRYNLDLFRWRVAPYRQWMENLYMDFSLLLRTFVQVGGVIENCPCNTGDEQEDLVARSRLQNLLEKAKTMPSASPDRLKKPLFAQKQKLALERFTNISRIFDCVECEKCRLHGKVKLAALQVALKANGIEKTPVLSLERNELTALINAIGYFGESIDIIHKFERRVYAMRQLTLTIVALVASTLAIMICRTEAARSLFRRLGLFKEDEIPDLLLTTETITTAPSSTSSSRKRRDDSGSPTTRTRRRRNN